MLATPATSCAPSYAASATTGGTPAAAPPSFISRLSPSPEEQADRMPAATPDAAPAQRQPPPPDEPLSLLRMPSDEADGANGSQDLIAGYVDELILALPGYDLPLMGNGKGEPFELSSNIHSQLETVDE